MSTKEAGSLFFPPSNWIAQMFEDHYPFTIWEERLRYLSQGGSLDVYLYLAAETLLSMVESYVTVLTGSFLNPGFRWMSVEHFAPPGKITKLVSLLRKSGGWEEILEDEEFVSVEAVAESGLRPSDEQLFSMLLGNPASRSSSGEILTTYDPEWLIGLVQAAAAFRGSHGSLLNAMKHGYRLPTYSDYSVDMLARGFAEHNQDLPYNPKEIREKLRSSSHVPAFWFLETDPEGKRKNEIMEGSKAELRLYALDWNRALAHCRLTLELFKLLFDSTRGSSRLDEAGRRIEPPLFEGILETPVRLFVPLQQPPGDEPYVVTAFVPKG